MSNPSHKSSNVSTGKTILITGSNRGIGYCILRILVTAHPENKYFLCARSYSDGSEALQGLLALDSIPTNADISVLELDVTSNASILAAIKTLRSRPHSLTSLDVLVNNAGIARLPPATTPLKTPDVGTLDALRASFAETLDTNISSVAVVCEAFLPLLLNAKAPGPRILNISSGRASLERSTTGKLPSTAVVSYSVSKTALNALGTKLDKQLDMALRRQDEGGDAKRNCRVWSANPGHCKTALNGYRGAKDPMDGAKVVEELLERDADVQSGFWEYEEGQLKEVPW